MGFVWCLASRTRRLPADAAESRKRELWRRPICLGLKVSRCRTVQEAVHPAHIITKRASKPPNPKFRYPPLSLIISFRPLRWAVRSLMLPQYHSFNISCITAAMASSVVDRCVWICSFNMRIARYLCIVTAVLSPTRGSASFTMHAEVCMAVWTRRALCRQKGTYCFMYRLDAMSGSPSRDALNREMKLTTCEPWCQLSSIHMVKNRGTYKDEAAQHPP